MSVRSIVVEFHPDGNRPLGREVVFLDGSFGDSDVIEFFSIAAANAAIARATNRRAGSKVAIINRSEKVPA